MPDCMLRTRTSRPWSSKLMKCCLASYTVGTRRLLLSRKQSITEHQHLLLRIAFRDSAEWTENNRQALHPTAHSLFKVVRQSRYSGPLFATFRLLE